MKKNIKMAFAVVALVAVGLGSYKAYGSYTAANMSEDDLLWAENIEAIGQTIESSANEYRTKENVQPCYGPEDKLLQCPKRKGNHLDTYLRSYEKKGEHYTCKVNAYCPAPWNTKPVDECYSNKNCSSGTVTYDKVPDEYKDGKTIETFKDHYL
ncbi:MAG: hypothetical protein K6E54_01850 [Bacteroidaceae bacterium]|nr:hypothetical protein [Bacteroidaceae bacterium]